MPNKVLYLHVAKNPANNRRFLEGMLRFARTVGWSVTPVQMDGLSPVALRELLRADDVIGCVRNVEWPHRNGSERSFNVRQVPVVVVDPRETDSRRRAGAVFCDNAAFLAAKNAKKRKDNSDTNTPASLAVSAAEKPAPSLFGPLMVVRRESTRGRGRREPFVLEAAETIRREACDGLTAAAIAASTASFAADAYIASATDGAVYSINTGYKIKPTTGIYACTAIYDVFGVETEGDAVTCEVSNLPNAFVLIVR